jgi:shikimate dehydrogenase
MKYGLIGEKLSHSFSKEIHEALADYTYEIRELTPDEVAPFLEAREFEGINVTIPYKEKVMPYLDEISDAARKIGAVNTVKKVDGRLIGDNTDFYGMREMILRAGIKIGGRKALILGTGGTSKTAKAVLADLGAMEIITVSRKAGENTVTYEKAIELHSDAEIIVNTTPLGMYPNTDAYPIDIALFPNLTGVIDAIYNPLRTNLILEAQKRGIPSVGGLMMLILQAARASEIFLGKKIDDKNVEKVVKNIFESKENIVLIGMPGSGKSTVGKIIAEITDRVFVDTDTVIEEMAGKHPAKIIRESGEDAFRDIETQAVREVSKKSGIIIATSGGIVKRSENIPLLRQNGKIIYLNCPTDELPVTPDRPLCSSRKAIEELYNTRHPLYLVAADASVEISHKTEPKLNANEVLKIFSEMIL